MHKHCAMFCEAENPGSGESNLLIRNLNVSTILEVICTVHFSDFMYLLYQEMHIE